MSTPSLSRDILSNSVQYYFHVVRHGFELHAHDRIVILVVASKSIDQFANRVEELEAEAYSSPSHIYAVFWRERSDFHGTDTRRCVEELPCDKNIQHCKGINVLEPIQAIREGSNNCQIRERMIHCERFNDDSGRRPEISRLPICKRHSQMSARIDQLLCEDVRLPDCKFGLLSTLRLEFSILKRFCGIQLIPRRLQCSAHSGESCCGCSPASNCRNRRPIPSTLSSKNTRNHNLSNDHSVIPLWIGRHFAMGRSCPQEVSDA